MRYNNLTDAFKDLKSDFEKATEDNKEMWQEVGDTTTQNMRVAQAMGKGSPDHNSGYEKFEALAPSTIKSRKYKKLSNLTNQKKSNLIESGQMHSDLTGVASKDSVLITHKTNRSKEIASYHEDGTANMPARKFMNFGKVNSKAVKTIILKWLDKYIKGR